jgi:hypothetical protein
MALIRAKEATIVIGDAVEEVSATTTLESQITGIVDYSGKVRDISISGGESDTELVSLFGSDADGRQNMESYNKPSTLREFSGTLILNDNTIAALNSGTPVAVGSTGYTRVQGDGTLTPKALYCKLVDASGNTLNCILNKATSMKLGDISLDSEGFAEQEITFRCLAKDYYEEYKAAD